MNPLKSLPLTLAVITALAFQNALAEKVVGQAGPGDQAHVMFDIRVDQLRGFADSVGLLPTEEDRNRMSPGDRMFFTLNRISGSIELPTDMATAEAIRRIVLVPAEMAFPDDGPPDGFKQPNDKSFDRSPEAGKGSDKSPRLSFRPQPGDEHFSPAGYIAARPSIRPRRELGLNFLVKLTFVDKGSRDAFLESLDFPERKENEHRLVVPAGDGSDEIALEVLARNMEDSALELGTRTWLDSSSRNFGTERLKAMWREMPEQAIRIVADLEPAGELIGQLVEIGKEDAPPAAAGFLDLATLAKSLRFGADTEKSPLFFLSLGCANETEAEQLRAGLDGLVGMAKLAGRQRVDEISAASPESGKMAGDMLAGLAATREGNQVTIEIARPDGFTATLGKLAGTMRKRAAEVNAMNEFRMIALAMHSFNDAYKRFPPGREREGVRRASWRVYVLPFVDEFAAYNQYLDDKDWDAPENKPLATQMPRVFGSDGANAKVCRISVDGSMPLRFEEVTDGLSQTIMLIEYPKGVPWMEPRDLDIDEAIELVTGLRAGESLRVALYDGSVYQLKSGLTADQLRPLFTWNGGEVVDLGEVLGD